MAAVMRTAPVARMAAAAPKATKSRVAAAAPKAFFGATKAFRAASLTTKAKASKMVTKMANAENDVARSYAAALLELGTSTGSLEAIHADMDALESVADASVMEFLSNPTMTKSKKVAVLEKMAKEGGFSAATSNFLQLLVAKGRIALLDLVITEFDSLYCEVTDTQVATVTSAVKLENEQQFLIAKKLQEMTGAKNIKLKPQVDAALIGGFVVTYGANGSQQIDMSVAGQLEKVAASMGVPMSAVSA